MRILFLFAALALLASCGSGDTPKAFCEVDCQKDTIKFIDDVHRLKPYIYISAANCLPDSVIWSYSGLGTNRKLSFDDFGGRKFQLNRKYMSVFFKDTSYAWLTFNDCATGRGYLLKLPFNKKESINKISSALNSLDKKFAVPDDLRTFFFIGRM